MLTEINIDAMVGPTHHFGGLGVGNVASHQHRDQGSSPKRAALEGLSKARLVASLGVPQFLWLPPRRPRFELLTKLGFRGTLKQQLEEALHVAPRALSAVFSSAFMWAANSATATPGVDAVDGRYHFTPANLISSWHRDPEAAERTRDLQRLFAHDARCQIHPPLPSIMPLRDEGAANHMRLCDATGHRGFNVFVHGAAEGLELASRFFPRHAREASEAIARVHRLDPATTFFLQQHPQSISAGVFHNDVIATSHQGLLLYHERAFLDADQELQRLEAEYQQRVGHKLLRVEVSEHELSLSEAVQSYFFNSQIVTPADPSPNSARMVLIAPHQCQESSAARTVVDRLVADDEIPIDAVHYVALGESMANGGGPACLRLRVMVDRELLESLPKRFQASDSLFAELGELIDRLYPDEIRLRDFTDLALIEQLKEVSEQLEQIH